MGSYKFENWVNNIANLLNSVVSTPSENSPILFNSWAIVRQINCIRLNCENMKYS